MTRLKIIISLLWVGSIASFFIYLYQSGIALRAIPELVQSYVSTAGVFAPMMFVLLFALRPLLFIPATLLSVSSGALFGPGKAIVILTISENLSSFVSYSIGKFMGKDLMDRLDKKNTYVHMFESYIQDNQFLSVLTLRLVFAPFDLVGYFSGAVGMRYLPFALGTFLGILPGLIMSAFLGGAIGNPFYLVISGVLIVFSFVISKIIKKKYHS